MARMTADEIIAEYEWLIEYGSTPLLAAEALGKSPEALSRMFWRYGRQDLAVQVDRAAKRRVA